MLLHTHAPQGAQLSPLTSPRALRDMLPMTEAAGKTVQAGRSAVRRILAGDDSRLVVVVGPCSIHDPEAALDYARRLQEQRIKHAETLEIVMRAYFEKPRTTTGWKGLINDPHLDESCDINDGLATARGLLLHLAEMGMPAGTEFLDPAVPAYLSDLVSWGAIGARTTESQTHRELVSGLPCPVGFKNGTSGDAQIAIDAVRASAHPHHVMTMSPEGAAAIARTPGNPDCHVILRGAKTPNYDARSVDAVCAKAQADGLRPAVMIDASHGNSGKDPKRQPEVMAEIGAQIAAGDHRIVGVMAESHLVGGRQTLGEAPLVYGQSITDGCLGWSETVTMLEDLAASVGQRRKWTQAA